MFIKNDYSFTDLLEKSWSGAKDTLKVIYDNDKEDELMHLLKEIFCDNIPTDTEVNDFLWFDPEYIYEFLGIEVDDE